MHVLLAVSYCQVATWQVLCNAMQYYIDTCCNRTPAASSPLDCSTWDNLFNREWQQQGSDAWQQLVSKAVPSKSCDTVDRCDQGCWRAAELFFRSLFSWYAIYLVFLIDIPGSPLSSNAPCFRCCACSLSVEELRLLFADLVPGSAAAGDEALSWLDCDKDGKVTKADVQVRVGWPCS